MDASCCAMLTNTPMFIDCLEYDDVVCVCDHRVYCGTIDAPDFSLSLEMRILDVSFEHDRTLVFGPI